MKQKYFDGDIVNSVKLVRRHPSNKGTFLCPGCNEEFETNIHDIVSGKSTKCIRCVRPNLTDKRFGKWKVLETGVVTNTGCSGWLCECECGKKQVVRTADLTSNKSKQCQRCGHLLGAKKIRKYPLGSTCWDRRNAHKKKTSDGSLKCMAQKLLEVSNACVYCEIDFVYIQKQIDHIIPLSKGGKHTIGNVVVCCTKCNLIKYNRTIFVNANGETIDVFSPSIMARAIRQNPMIDIYLETAQ